MSKYDFLIPTISHKLNIPKSSICILGTNEYFKNKERYVRIHFTKENVIRSFVISYDNYLLLQTNY